MSIQSITDRSDEPAGTDALALAPCSAVCPIGISPESWYFCSAGTCTLCRDARRGLSMKPRHIKKRAKARAKWAAKLAAREAKPNDIAEPTPAAPAQNP